MIHIHNGDITASLARRAGIAGEHVPFRETLLAGPVPHEMTSAPSIEVRARFLSEDYGHNLLRVRNDLIEQERVLSDEPAKHDEVVLWFEHDLFCLVNFLYLLQRVQHPRLSAVWCNEPLGTRNEAQMPALYESRAAVTPMMLSAAREAWAAFTSADPIALNRFLANDNRDFPFLRDGLTLHAARFPSWRNGLGDVENRALALIAGGATDFVTLFNRFDTDPPRYGLGDAELLRELRALAWCAVPLITITEQQDSGPPQALFAMTAAGERVLRGEIDALTLNEPDFWLGGTHLTRDTLWRWDDTSKTIRSAAS